MARLQVVIVLVLAKRSKQRLMIWCCWRSEEQGNAGGNQQWWWWPAQPSVMPRTQKWWVFFDTKMRQWWLIKMEPRRKGKVRPTLEMGTSVLRRERARWGEDRDDWSRRERWWGLRFDAWDQLGWWGFDEKKDWEGKAIYRGRRGHWSVLEMATSILFL